MARLDTTLRHRSNLINVALVPKVLRWFLSKYNAIVIRGGQTIVSGFGISGLVLQCVYLTSQNPRLVLDMLS